MPNRDRHPSGPDIRTLEPEDMRYFLPQVFAPSGALPGFCLEWLLDWAEFSNGRKS